METMNERWIREKDEETAAEIARKDAEIAEILAITNKEDLKLAAEIKAKLAKFEREV